MITNGTLKHSIQEPYMSNKTSIQMEQPTQIEQKHKKQNINKNGTGTSIKMELNINTNGAEHQYKWNRNININETYTSKQSTFTVINYWSSIEVNCIAVSLVYC